MTPEILKELLDKYSCCETYMDKGSICGDLQYDAEFATYFARPNKFKFEWKSYSGFEMEITCIDNKAISVWPKHPKQDTDFLTAVNLSTTLTKTAVPFICRLLLPEVKELYYDVMDFEPFRLSKEDLQDENYVWIKSDENNIVHSEKLLVDCASQSILERRVRANSTEHQAKQKAAEYFSKTDPQMASKMESESEKLKNSSITYVSKYFEVVFDKMSEELKRDKFKF